MRKIEKIQTLDQQTSTLKAENEELAGLAKKLKDQVNIILTAVIQHAASNLCRCTDCSRSFAGT